MILKIYFDYTGSIKPDKSLEKIVKSAAARALVCENFIYDTELSVTFTSDEEIHKMNKKFREVDRSTDVLSFPLIDFHSGEKAAESPVQLGDIVISVETAARQADEYGHSIEREIAFLTVHSVLHLLGYDHELSETDENDMRDRQRKILKKAGFER